MAIGGFQFGKYINIGPKQQPLGGSSRSIQNEIDNVAISGDLDTDCAFVVGTLNTISGGATAVIGSGNIVKSGSTKNLVIGDENTMQEACDDSILIGKGNTMYSGSDQSFILGRSNNTSVEGSSNRNLVFGFLNQVTAATESVVFGQSNTVVGPMHALIAGTGNTAAIASENSFILGVSNTTTNDALRVGMIGNNGTHTTNANYSLVTGFHGKANIQLGHTHGGGRLGSVAGSIQFTDILVACQTTDATQTTMVAQQDSGKLHVPLNSSMMFRIDIVARRTSTQTESAAYEILGCIKNDAGTTALEGTITKTVIAEGDANWDVTAVANNTDDTLEIKVTGAAGKNINWVASGRLTETNGA
tara:strand:+ start:74 stop:1153 length:1080 start_codon:yes stop_codon:yes gene_type:complete